MPDEPCIHTAIYKHHSAVHKTGLSRLQECHDLGDLLRVAGAPQRCDKLTDRLGKARIVQRRLVQRRLDCPRRYHIQAYGLFCPGYCLATGITGHGVFGAGIGHMGLPQGIGVFQCQRFVAGEHGRDHRLLIGGDVGGRNRSDHYSGRPLALGQRIGQTVKQLTDAKVVDRHDGVGHRAGANPGAAHQAVEHPVAVLEHRTDGGLAPACAGQVGNHLGICPVDADDAVPGGA